MIDSIKALYCSDNLVLNGDFEDWLGTSPYHWTASEPTQIEQSDDSYKNSYSIKLIRTAAGTVVLTGNINAFSNCKMVVSFAFKNSDGNNNLNVFTAGGVSQTIHSGSRYGYWQRGWAVWDFVVGQTMKLGAKLATVNDEYVLVDDVKVYYINESDICLENVKNTGSVARTMEDKVFRFKSSDFTFDIMNRNVSGFFNPENFIDPSFTKPIGLFINYNTDKYLFTMVSGATGTDTYDSKSLSVESLELYSYFQDNDNFVGNVVWDADVSASVEERTSKVTRFDVTTPTDVEDVIEDLNDELVYLVIANDIPIYPDEISKSISGNFLSPEKFLGYIQIVNSDEEGAMEVIDYYYDSANDRLFVLLISNNHTPGDYEESDNAVDLYELKNGTSLEYITTIYAQKDYQYYLTLGFMHTVESGYYYNLMVYQIVYLAPDTYDIWLWGFKYNAYSGKPEMLIDYKYLSSTNAATAAGYITVYISAGYAVTPGGATDNLQYIGDNQTVTVAGSAYVFGDISSAHVDVGGSDRYDMISGSISFSVYKFPHVITCGYSNTALGKILKDICVAEDGFWYFEYDITSGNPELVMMLGRRDSDDPDGIDDAGVDTDVLKTTNKLTKLSFDDIETAIYQNDPSRMDMLKDFYNDKYGGTKRDKELTMFGHANYALGQEVYVSSLGNSISFLIKDIELTQETSESDIKKRTIIRLTGIAASSVLTDDILLALDVNNVHLVTKEFTVRSGW